MMNITPGALDQFEASTVPEPRGPVIDGSASPVSAATPCRKELGPMATLLLGAVAVAAASYLVPKALEYAPRLFHGREIEDDYADGWEGGGDTVDFEVEQ